MLEQIKQFLRVRRERKRIERAEKAQRQRIANTEEAKRQMQLASTYFMEINQASHTTQRLETITKAAKAVDKARKLDPTIPAMIPIQGQIAPLTQDAISAHLLYMEADHFYQIFKTIFHKCRYNGIYDKDLVEARDKSWDEDVPRAFKAIEKAYVYEPNNRYIVILRAQVTSSYPKISTRKKRKLVAECLEKYPDDVELLKLKEELS